MLRTIDRPTKATLRPCSCAESRTCWMRGTWLGKLETMPRRGGGRDTWGVAGARARSAVSKPGSPAGRGPEYLVDGRGKVAFGCREAGDLSVGGVHQE